MLITYIRSLVVRADLADDVFQSTLMVAWRRLDDFDRSRPFGPWLRGIAAKLALEQRRKNARETFSCEPEVLEALNAAFNDFERTPSDSFRQRLERLETCLQRLPDAMREVLDLGYGRGLLLGSVAAALGISEETVKKRAQRARHALAECLGLAGGAA